MQKLSYWIDDMDRDKRIWYLSLMRAAKVQTSLRIRAVSPEPPLFAHTSSELRGTFRQKTRSLAPLNGWACAIKICNDGMLEDTNSLDRAHIFQKEAFSDKSGRQEFSVWLVSKIICWYSRGNSRWIFECNSFKINSGEFIWLHISWDW